MEIIIATTHEEYENAISNSEAALIINPTGEFYYKGNRFTREIPVYYREILRGLFA